MRARREPASPPLIPGFEYVKLLGLGGFADVFEYRQDLPSRSVAVKVLLASSLDDETRVRFSTEANLMAQLSHHPSIVTIHHADISADGRPYLVMEYCSRPGIGARYRTERISVQETLRTGIRLASAVESAHRLGILHRDIKPANILTTDFGYPALTDFGIAAATGGAGAAGTGMSIPWSPPELLQSDPHGDTRADVYSLGATVYSMLAGRSPFEIAGQPNGAADLIYRIERSPLPNIDRDDVPPALQAVLARSMSKDPVRRYPTAVGLAHALQQIERSLGLTVTQIDVLDPAERAVPRARPATAEVTAEATRARPIVTIDPSAQSPAPPQAPVAPVPAPYAPVASAPAAAPFGTPAAPGAYGYPGAPVAPSSPSYLAPAPQPMAAAPATVQAPGASRGGAGRTVAIVVSVIVLAGVLLGAAYLAFGRDAGVGPSPSPTVTTAEPSPEPTTITSGRVPSPTNLQSSVVSEGLVRFTWVNPEPLEGDGYLWGLEDSENRERVELPYVDVPVPDGEDRVCIEVSLVRSNGQMSTTPLEGCFR
ncbi:serine/threonine-protein kinase [Sanguibacter sp. HDW7]|uniref:serine/threonine protein kinase n=1 Tax=Sanguibacter sp. HDW7 TaxID=2714931 RepID=UPI001409783C|nr:serine/threonine-protein kinase [Sanguibacter sp. HDW7]QIK82618.1 serine/threonine protein kinase [Sanguibacter sp. HDW7]